MKKKIGLITALLMIMGLVVPLVSTTAVLAAPSVASVTETEFDSSDDNHLVQMPGTVSPDDLLIVFFVNTGTSNVTTPANWNQLASNSSSDGAGGDPDVRFSVYYKKAVGNEDGTTVDFVTSASQKAAAQVYRITSYGWHGTTAPEISAAATGNSNLPDPASLNPGGWATEDTLWIAACGFGDDDGMGAYPAGYGNQQESSASGSGDDCELNSARRANTVASENPGAFDISASDTENWVAFTIAVRPAVANCGSVKTQVAMMLDGSGSIDPADFGIMLEGVAGAVTNSTCIPHDGSVELTLIQFSTYARLEIGPVVITDANAAGVADAIREIDQMEGFTCISCGFCLAADTLAASPCFDPSLKQAINLVTDGEPNYCSCAAGAPCGHSGTSCNTASAQASAVCAREYLISTLGMTNSTDEIDAEGIGITDANRDWLRDNIVWPQPGYIAPPFDQGPGWIRVFATFEEFVPSLCEKFRLLVEEYSLTVVSDGCCPITVGDLGSVNASDSDTFTVPSGTNVTLTVDDTDPCCVFDFWTGNVTGAPNSTNPITITMDGDKTVTATCHWLSYNLTVESDGCCPITVGTQGSVGAGESDTFAIPCGTNVTLTASNSSSCGFVQWTVDGGGPTTASNTIVVHMDANHSATVVCNTTAIGDTVFYDNNNNGTQGPGEGGVAGVDVELYQDDGDGVFEPGTDDQLEDTATTGGDGKYVFSDLEAGCYWVLVDETTLPPEVTMRPGSNPSVRICLDPGDSFENADFPALTQAPPVGGEAYPISKLFMLAPWIVLAVLLAGGIGWYALRRRRAQS